MAPLDSVGIVGLGAIGGSLARALMACGVRAAAWSASDDDNARARHAGIDVVASMHDLASASTIVIAVPVDAVAPVATHLLSIVRADALVLHAASLQRAEALDLSAEAGERVLGTHPIAGSTESGFTASRVEIFRGAAVSIESRATDVARVRAEALWRSAGAARFRYRDAETHDRELAWTSHLPQIVATSLAAALASIAPDLAGPGARDTTRLAQSDWTVWRDILARASPDLPAAMLAVEAALRECRIAIEEGRVDSIAETWSRARDWRRTVERAT